jgi:acetyl/propionyl-CoA carboxylase alpha subunit
MKEVKKEGKSDLMLRAPMPGIVTKVYQKPGAFIKKGDSIMAMEAMKM